MSEEKTADAITAGPPPRAHAIRPGRKPPSAPPCALRAQPPVRSAHASHAESALVAGFRRMQGEPELFSLYVLSRPLRAYQVEPLRAILQAVRQHSGQVFTVMFARQMGKNELSAHLECLLLNLHQAGGGSIIKTAPTYQPQLITSKARLLQALDNPLNRGAWRMQDGYRVTLGKASCAFVSGYEGARVVGMTASLLLEVDEAQDVAEEKYLKDFRPMASSTNACTVLYGTAWSGDTLLEKQAALNRDLEARDGLRRHFQYDWQALAATSPQYRAFVEGERQRLGEAHPLFRTQYLLQPLGEETRFLSAQQRAQLAGDHQGYHERLEGKEYVAGVDLAGEDEQAQDAALRASKPRRDSVVVTVAELDYTPLADLLEPRVKIVEHYWWTGRKQRALYATLVDVLRNVWGCRRVAVDGSGVGAGVASFLAAALGRNVVEQFVFSSASKSELGYALLAAVNGGRVKMYRQMAGCQMSDIRLAGEPNVIPGNSATDDLASGNPISEFWRQMEQARYQVAAGQTLRFFVPEKEGHDDFLMSLALCVRAGQGCTQAAAGGLVQRAQPYNDGRF